MVLVSSGVEALACSIGAVACRWTGVVTAPLFLPVQGG